MFAVVHATRVPRNGREQYPTGGTIFNHEATNGKVARTHPCAQAETRAASPEKPPVAEMRPSTSAVQNLAEHEAFWPTRQRLGLRALLRRLRVRHPSAHACGYDGKIQGSLLLVAGGLGKPPTPRLRARARQQREVRPAPTQIGGTRLAMGCRVEFGSKQGCS